MAGRSERRDNSGSYRRHERAGWEILVGKGARDNDLLTFEVAERQDLWLHVSGWSGSHVVIRVPEGAGEPPREVVQYAAQLAAWNSKARGAGGKVEVHVCRAGDVHKKARMPPGQVQLSNWTAIRVYVKEP